MNKSKEFSDLVKKANNGETSINASELNEIRLRFMLENGLCEETLSDIFQMSERGDFISETIADGLISKYLYEPPAMNKGMASTIRKSILALGNKFDINAINNMILGTLYADIQGVKYAVGLGQVVQDIRVLNEL